MNVIMNQWFCFIIGKNETLNSGYVMIEQFLKWVNLVSSQREKSAKQNYFLCLESLVVLLKMKYECI